MNRYLTLGLLLICIICALAQNPRRKPPPKVVEPPLQIDRTCFDCICQASSNCDETLKCHNTPGGGYYCGPYVISWAYWHDAGRPGDKGGPHDFETCLNSKKCSETTVEKYMNKHRTDCDGNGVIDCYDLVKIHKLGPGGCSSDSIYNTDYYEKFDICYSSYETSYNSNNDENYNVNDNIGGQGDFPDFPGGHLLNARRNE